MMNREQTQYEAARAAQEAALSHEGGAHYGWARDMERNTYTIDPAEPPRDAEDLEKDRLIEEAKRLAAKYDAQNWTIRVGGRIRRWLT